MRLKSIVATALLTMGLAAFAVPTQAQITEDLKVTIKHPWVFGEKDMPAGSYVFRMEKGAQQQQMSATNSDTSEKALCIVQQANNNSPTHNAELVFDHVGDKMFLRNVFQGGARFGVAIQTSKAESQLQDQGQKAVQETEVAEK